MGSASRFVLALLVAWEASAAELHDAARRGDLAAVERLLAAGATVDATDGGGASALYLAAGEGQAAVVVRLLSAGANPQRQVSGPFGSTGTPMHAAIRYGHLDVVRALLEAGVDPNLPDDGVGPPLHTALRRGQTAAAGLLRSFGARPIRAEPVAALHFTTSTAEGGRVAWFEDCIVHPEHLRKGIGNALLEHVIAQARAEGALRVMLLTDGDNTRALALYRKLGFKPSSMLAMRLKL